MRFKLLDLFCCAGGCSVGYSAAGFEVTGVDIEDRLNYPFKFIKADAMEILNDRRFLSQFDVIHASPPCQKYSRCNYFLKKEYPDLIQPVREQLIRSRKLYVIENVVEAPMDGIVLCGSMFGLKVIRHRRFESNIFLMHPFHKRHSHNDRNFITVAGNGGEFTVETGKKAMGIEWTISKKELAQAIPPEYTKFIGEQLIEYLRLAEMEMRSASR